MEVTKIKSLWIFYGNPVIFFGGYSRRVSPWTSYMDPQGYSQCSWYEAKTKVRCCSLSMINRWTGWLDSVSAWRWQMEKCAANKSLLPCRTELFKSSLISCLDQSSISIQRSMSLWGQLMACIPAVQWPLVHSCPSSGKYYRFRVKKIRG